MIKKQNTTVKKKPASKSNTKTSQREKKIQEIKKNLLNQKKALLVGAIEALNELPGQTVFPDLGDQATAEIDRNFMLRLKGREQKLLKKIEEAMERINQGVFGICDKCGLEIDVRRLEARPVTTMCIECKTLQEEEEKLMEK
jgi:DnaK suppressor protein